MTDLSIVIVSYNTRSLLQEALAAAYETVRRSSLEVIVLDNASNDGSAAMVQTAFPQVRLIANDTNRGFSAACNQGIQQSHGRYVLLLNPDTVALPSSLDSMVEFLNAHPRAGAVGGKLLNTDGSFQLCCAQRLPDFWSEAFEITLRWLLPRTTVLGSRVNGFQEHDHVRPAAQISGACLLLRRKALEEVGLLDEGFYIFWEDFDWCARAAQVGWELYCLPQARIMHHRGVATQRPEVEVRMSLEFERSRQRYLRKHSGELAYRLFQLVTIAVSLAKAPLWWALAWLRRRDGSRFQRKLAAQLAVLRLSLLGS